MGNTKKTVTDIPKIKVGQYLFLFDIRYYLKVTLTYRKLLELKRNTALGKDRKTENLKIKFQQIGSNSNVQEIKGLYFSNSLPLSPTKSY